MPCVTLIVPIYNTERYLRRCLDSVLAQKVDDMEVLLMNDGSTDDSLSICLEYADKDSRFIVVDKKNSGVSDTRNMAMQMANGEYLQFLDSDDWLTPDATETLIQAADNQNADMVIADFYRVDGKHYTEKQHIKKTHIMSREEYAMEMADHPADFYYGVMWNKLYRKSIVDEYQLKCDTSLNWSEDFLFNLNFIRYGRRFLALQHPIYYYMKRKGSLVSTEAISTDGMQIKRLLLGYYRDLYKSLDLYDDYKLKINSYIVAVASDRSSGLLDPLSHKLETDQIIPEKDKENSKMFHVEHSFGPVYDEDSRLLILGSFPSVQSREQGFYYAHPMNRFWSILADLTFDQEPVSIEEKKEFLHKHHIALWDVVHSCDINGSRDSSIRNVIPVDLSEILQMAKIEKIVANGGKAYQLYHRYLEPSTGIPIEKLPSTSPANAIFTNEKLLIAWGDAISDFFVSSDLSQNDDLEDQEDG